MTLDSSHPYLSVWDNSILSITLIIQQYLDKIISNISLNWRPDSWDGTAESNVDGSDVGPWQTLNHAIEELRKIRPNPPSIEDQAYI